jgi:hypothetical protein
MIYTLEVDEALVSEKVPLMHASTPSPSSHFEFGID